MALTSAGPSGFPSIIVLVLGQFLLQVFSWTTLNHYCTLQALTSRFQQMTLPPLLRKLMLLDILGVLVKVIHYKQQNPIYWLNVTFVKKLCCSSESLRKDQRPSLKATRPPPCLGVVVANTTVGVQTWACPMHWWCSGADIRNSVLMTSEERNTLPHSLQYGIYTYLPPYSIAFQVDISWRNIWLVEARSHACTLAAGK